MTLSDMKSFKYVLLRAIPDAIRGEQINVGLVAFFPTKCRIYIGVEPWRLRALNPNLDSILLGNWVSDLEAMLNSLSTFEDQMFFLSGGFGAIKSDAAASTIFAETIEDADHIALDLIAQLVTTPARVLSADRSTRAKPKTKLQSQLKSWFRQAQLYSPRLTDLSKGRVVSGYPVDVADDLYADFALKNGAVHVIEAIDLRGIERLSKSVRGEAGLTAVLFDQARKSLSAETRCVAITTADDYSIVKPVLGLIARYADDMIAIESAHDRQRFSDFVYQSLHPEKELPPMFNQ